MIIDSVQVVTRYRRTRNGVQEHCRTTQTVYKIRCDVCEMSLPELVKNLIVVAVLTVVAVVIVNDLHKSKVLHYANIINGMLVVVKLFRYCYRLVANTAILPYPNRRHLESRYTQAV
jgi:ribosomal protein S26